MIHTLCSNFEIWFTIIVVDLGSNISFCICYLYLGRKRNSTLFPTIRMWMINNGRLTRRCNVFLICHYSNECTNCYHTQLWCFIIVDCICFCIVVESSALTLCIFHRKRYDLIGWYYGSPYYHNRMIIVLFVVKLKEWAGPLFYLWVTQSHHT